MWCAVTPTVHFSAAVVFFQSASLSFSRTAVASFTLASNCLASASPLAPMVSSSVCPSLDSRTGWPEIDNQESLSWGPLRLIQGYLTGQARPLRPTTIPNPEGSESQSRIGPEQVDVAPPS